MSLALNLRPSKLEIELAAEADRLGLSLTEYSVRITAAGSTEAKIVFALGDGTITYLLESAESVDLDDASSLASAQVKSVKVETKTPFVVKSEVFTQLSPEAKAGLLKLLELVRERPRMTGAELLGYWQGEGLVGTRREIADSQAHARALRQQAERRQ